MHTYITNDMLLSSSKNPKFSFELGNIDFWNSEFKIFEKHENSTFWVESLMNYELFLELSRTLDFKGPF